MIKTLSPHITLRLLHCFEACLQQSVGDVQGITAQFLEEHYPELLPLVDDWFRTVGYAGVWLVSCFDDSRCVALEACPDSPDKFRYRSPEWGGWEHVDTKLAQTRQVRTNKVITGLTDLLEIPAYLHDQVRRPVIEGCLWKLGHVRLRAGFHYPVWFFRGAGTHTTELITGLRNMQGRDKGVILTAADDIPLPDDLPDGFVWLPFQTALVEYLDHTRLDLSTLYNAVMYPQFCLQKRQPVRYDATSQTLYIQGKNPWHIQGESQAAAVGYLYELSQQDIWEASAKDIRMAVARKTNKPLDKISRTIAALFAGNSDWDTYITNSKRGFYCFKME